MKKFLLPMLFIIVCNLYSQTWAPKYKGVFSSIYFPDNNIGWAVGYEGGYSSARGIIYKTTDGGNNWWRQYEVNNSELNSVHFVDTSTGWVCGSKGVILKTTDGGSSWLNQPSGTSYGLKGMFWLDENQGWINSNDGARVLKTTDGGSNWVIYSSGTGWWLRSIFFINSNIGWISGDGGTIRKTTNGGSTWNAQVSGVPYWKTLSQIFFVDSLTGWIVGGNYDTSGVILKTTNGGLNWVEKACPVSRHLESVRFLNANNGWAVGFNSTIIRTTDGGDNWTSEQLPQWMHDHFIDITFRETNSNTYDGWICGYGLNVLKASGIITSMKASDNSPTLFELSQNYPNPFNSSTTIEYQIAKQGNVEIGIYDINGRLVKSLLNSTQYPGSYTIQWDGQDEGNKTVASGTYFYQIKSDGIQLVKKMLILK